MAGRETHFELFLRKSPKASWALADASTDRQSAISKAQTILSSYPNGGIRITKEELNTSTGDYNSVVVTTIGMCDEPLRRKQTPLPIAPTTSCVAPSDLFTPAARKTTQEVMPRFLQRHRVLPGELVYRTDLLEQLEASGSEMTQAIQRVAIARAGGGDDLHSIARQLHELVAQAINKSFKDKKDGQYLIYDRPLPELVKAARAKKSPRNAFSSALADRLKRATTWPAKLATLVDIWKEVETLGPLDQDFCNDILSDYFSEWIEAPGTLSFILGDARNGAEVVHRLIGVIEPRSKDSQKPDPLAGLPAAQTLADAISLGVLPSARNRVISRIFEELSSSKRLQPEDLKIEFDLLKRFGDRLVSILQDSRRGEMYEAFCARSKMLMTLDTVEGYLSRFEVLDRPQKLLDLQRNLVGHDSQSKLVAMLRGYISQPAFEVAILGSKKPLITLSTLRATQIQLLSSSLPEQDKLHGAQDLDMLGVRMLGQSKLFPTMVSKAGSPEKAALALFRLACEALPRGQCARLASNTAIKLLRTEGARDALKDHPALKVTIRSFSQQASLAGEIRNAS